MERRFLFGQPVLPAKPAAHGPKRVFILGAYPSALHVRWFGPGRDCLIQAVAVDNEPEPFWTGADERERIEDWLGRVSFHDDWGRVEPCGKLNGPSGHWVQERVLDALGVRRDDAWITDCLDTYYESTAAAQRLDSGAIAHLVKLLCIPARCHEPHPSEADIVRLAKANHRRRLLTELDTARPERVVTLGNAALRVFADLVDSSDASIGKLDVDGYGDPVTATLGGRKLEWLPLAHPAAPQVYRDAHNAWLVAVRSSACQTLRPDNLGKEAHATSGALPSLSHRSSANSLDS